MSKTVKLNSLASSILMEYIKRTFNLPKQSCFIFGPRGTGKSTLMLEKYPDAFYLDLLNPLHERQCKAMPERLIEYIKPHATKCIIIDEIQRVPELLAVIHQLIERYPHYHFILTGSSPRKLKRTGADLLGGRAVNRCLHPFIASELGDAFDMKLALQFGLLPLVKASSNPQDTLNAYIDLYLKEEIQSEGLVRHLGNFSRFLEIISFSHANILNISHIARECAVKRKTVENYIAILEDLLLAYRIPIFSKRAQRELITHPKFYLFDTGVYQAIRPRGWLDQPNEIDGHALEGLVMQHLKAWCDYTQPSHQVMYWRTKHGVEVDFVVYGEHAFWAIEVKLSKRLSDHDLKGLVSFQQDYPMASCMLLYSGNDILIKKNILCIPCELFLKWLRPNFFDLSSIYHRSDRL